MASSPVFNEPRANPFVRVALIVSGALVLLALVWFIYVQMTGTLTTKVKDDQPVQISPDLIPPPPPPPPPPPEPEVKPPEPTDAPKPTPEAAAPKPDAPAPMTVAADAQSGTDAFGLRAGNGKGSGNGGGTGTCTAPPCGTDGGGGFSDAMYRGNLARDLQDRILDNDRVNRLSFKATFAISVGAGGQVIGAQLLSSSGDPKRDQLLIAILQATRGLEPPPSQVKFPQRVVVTGRRSF